MKSNILAFFFTIGSIAMAVLIIWFYNLSDRSEPEIRFVAMDLTYDADTDEKSLLQGAMAYDSKDGDVTDRIVVEKTILNEESETAVVYYAVSDLSGNVTKQSRVFPADIASLKNEELIEEESDIFPEGFMIESSEGEVINTDETTEESEEGGEGNSAENASRANGE